MQSQARQQADQTRDQKMTTNQRSLSTLLKIATATPQAIPNLHQQAHLEPMNDNQHTKIENQQPSTHASLFALIPSPIPQVLILTLSLSESIPVPLQRYLVFDLTSLTKCTQSRQ